MKDGVVVVVATAAVVTLFGQGRRRQVYLCDSFQSLLLLSSLCFGQHDPTRAFGFGQGCRGGHNFRFDRILSRRGGIHHHDRTKERGRQHPQSCHGDDTGSVPGSLTFHGDGGERGQWQDRETMGSVLASVSVNEEGRKEGCMYVASLLFLLAICISLTSSSSSL
eukprot:scaffold8690_cov190-Amphora_coffeaeformis.AAC.13